MMFSGRRTPGTFTPKKRKKKGEGSKKVYYEDSPEKYPMGALSLDSDDYKGADAAYVDYGGYEQRDSPIPLLANTPAPVDDSLSSNRRAYGGSPVKKKGYSPLRAVSPVPMLAPIERRRSPSPIRRPLTSAGMTSHSRGQSLPRVITPAPPAQRLSRTPERRLADVPIAAGAPIATISYSQPTSPEGPANVITPLPKASTYSSYPAAQPPFSEFDERVASGRQAPVAAVPAADSAFRLPDRDERPQVSGAAAASLPHHRGLVAIPPIQVAHRPAEEEEKQWGVTPSSPPAAVPTPAPQSPSVRFDERPKTAAGHRHRPPPLVRSPSSTHSPPEMIRIPVETDVAVSAPIANPEPSPEDDEPDSPAKIAVTQAPTYHPRGRPREKSAERTRNSSPIGNESPSKSPSASPSRKQDSKPETSKSDPPGPENNLDQNEPKQYMLNSLNDRNLNKERSRKKHADGYHSKSEKKSKRKDKKRSKHSKATMNITEDNGDDEAGNKACKHVASHLQSTSESKEVEPTTGTGDESSEEDDSPWVRFNVGGCKFATKFKTLQSQPDSRLGKLARKLAVIPLDVERVFTYDRNPLMFGYILDYYRDGHLHVPQSICIKYFKDEMSYWGVPDDAVAACCWERYKATDDDDIVLGQLARSEKGMSADGADEDQGCRGRLWRVLDQPKSSTCAQLWALFYVLIVLVSTAALLLDTHPAFRLATNRTPPTDTNNSKEIELAITDSHPAILYVELITTLIFSIEFLLRLACCPQRMLMAKDVFTWTELASVIAQWNILVITAIYPTYRSDGSVRGRMVDVSGTLRVLRVLRLFRLARHYKGLRVFMLAMAASATELLMLAILLIIFIIIFATMIYYAELGNDDGNFKNIPECFWWAIITMTTVGYGDVFPSTDAGYVVGSLCAVAGLLATGLPIPIIATNFQLYYTYSKMRDRIMSKNDPASVVDQALNKLMFFKSTHDSEHEDESTRLNSEESDRNSSSKALNT